MKIFGISIAASFLAGFAALAAPGPAPAAHGKAHHVVVVVWDGMRPDFVTQSTTPNLWKLAQGGVTFRRHHPAFPSSTEVNGTQMATGAYPEHSGLMANREYRPAADPLKAVGTELPETMKTDPHYLAVPSVAQVLHAAGMRTAVAGSKGVALLQDWSHQAAGAAAAGSALFFDGNTEPPGLMARLTGTLGPWPPTIEFPNLPRDVWTTRALTGQFWAGGVPPYSMLWMSDPDYSQHQLAPGSPLALAALKSVDDRLGSVLDALDARGVKNDTDVLVISDHGFSTIARNNNIVGALKAGGLKVTGTGFASTPGPGEVLAVGNGGSILFYIIGHDESIGRSLIAIVQKMGCAGVIFSRWNLPGTFPLHAVRIATRQAPDVVVSMRWNSGANKYGTPGLLEGDAAPRAGKGTHASLSAWDMHNTLIAAGPDFRAGWQDDIPTGNIDLAPTVLWILGVRQPVRMDGRVLLEAMPGHRLGRAVTHRTLRATDPAAGWTQYLKVSAVGRTLYFDEGNPGPGV